HERDEQLVRRERSVPGGAACEQPAVDELQPVVGDRVGAAELRQRERLWGRRRVLGRWRWRRRRRKLVAMRKTYRGKDVEVTFDLDLCIHIGECLRGQRSVFMLDRRPWVLPDEGDADEIVEVVERCPSGALQYRRFD